MIEPGTPLDIGGGTDIPIAREISDSTITYDVGMNDYRRVDIPREDKKTYIIKTVGRLGCDSVLVWKTAPDGNQQVLLTHYPPTELPKHREILEEFAPHGDETTKVVYLTAGSEGSSEVATLSSAIQETVGFEPYIVRITAADLQQTSWTDAAHEIARDPLLYQLIAVKGYNGNPDSRRIIVPAPNGKNGGNAYVAQF